MVSFLISIALAAGQAQSEDPIDAVIRAVSLSGVALELAQPESSRVNPEPRIAPGAPPLLAFRYLEGNEHHRFNQLNLVIDDAGH